MGEGEGGRGGGRGGGRWGRGEGNDGQFMVLVSKQARARESERERERARGGGGGWQLLLPLAVWKFSWTTQIFPEHPQNEGTRSSAVTGVTQTKEPVRMRERGGVAPILVRMQARESERETEKERERDSWLKSTRRFPMGGAADLPGGRPFERGKA